MIPTWSSIRSRSLAPLITSSLNPSKSILLPWVRGVPSSIGTGVVLFAVVRGLLRAAFTSLDVHRVSTKQLLRVIVSYLFGELTVALKVVSTSFWMFLLINQIPHLFGEIDETRRVVPGEAHIPVARHSFWQEPIRVTQKCRVILACTSSEQKLNFFKIA